MIILCVVLALLLVLLLLPLGVLVEYDRPGLAAFAKIGPLRLKLYPPKEGKQKREKPPKEAPKEGSEPEETPKSKGGSLDLIRAALPLVKPALAGVKKRLTIRDLELRVTWAASDPADAAIGYGYANAALGMLWAVVSENFKVKRSRLGCGVDFDAQSPTVYLKAILTTNLWQALTLALPLLIRFLRNTARLKAEKAEKTKKEA